MAKRRSVGVVMISVYFFIMFLISFPITRFFLYSMGPFFFPRRLLLIITFYLTWLFLVDAIIILFLKNWIRILSLICSIILLVTGLLFSYFVVLLVLEYGIKHTHFELIFVPACIFIIPPALIIYYLIRPKVKEQFK